MPENTDQTDFLLSSYQYDLPEDRIAQEPPAVRGNSRLMVVQRSGELAPRHRQFRDLPDELPEGALLVANNSRVLPARLHGLRHTGGKVEFLLLSPLPAVLARVEDAGSGLHRAPAEGLLRSGGHPSAGEWMSFGADIRLRLVEAHEFGRWDVELEWRGDLAACFEAAGSIPLPPYIRRTPGAGDRERYQTIYAREEKTGSVAAPTAGLHFTPELRAQLDRRGYGWKEITLYVGYGTFSPVRCNDIREHSMHGELIDVPEETVEAIARAKAEGRPVIAVGTTSARALEGAYAAAGGLAPFHGVTSIFLYPGRPVHVIDGLITNFHLPGSTLIMLVAALMGRERILEAYRQAVRENYRFFSYGDAMFVRP
ncbi:MAG: tRNA preQ1(34) S-adenosylmethionine ribosyltransferase-isomerase QueA [Desulfovibrionaceae bacterium]|nr:tRNA preQ1(34) S-adenosylmethionine ribosyltransferase-isomerase QueA [Desulfovibrionaceae bacterium]